MRDAEEASSCSLSELMERAGHSLAEAALRHAGPIPALIVCGPGNNGGDGYVAARHLKARGIDVRVAALAEPTTELSHAAREGWDGPVETFVDTMPAPLLIDCLFGTGLKRGLDEAVCAKLSSLAEQSRIAVAADLPSGVDGGQWSPLVANSVIST